TGHRAPRMDVDSSRGRIARLDEGNAVAPPGVDHTVESAFTDQSRSMARRENASGERERSLDRRHGRIGLVVPFDRHLTNPLVERARDSDQFDIPRESRLVEMLADRRPRLP